MVRFFVKGMSIENDMKVLAKMTRAQISKKKQSGRDGLAGQTFIVAGPSGRKYAIKMFKANKSTTVINNEYDLQNQAASKGVAPAVYAKNTTEKYIIMQKMTETIVDYKKRTVGDKEWRLPRPLQAQLYALCVRLDAAKVVQNDGNPLNLMLNDSGRLYIIDYGFATSIDAKVLHKRGPQPNVNLTLWHFQRHLNHYRIRAPLLKEIQDKYMKAFDYTDEELLAEGEALLEGDVENKTSKPVVRPSYRRAVRTSSRAASSSAVQSDDADMKAALAASLHLNNPTRRRTPKVRKKRRPHARTPMKVSKIKMLLSKTKVGSPIFFVRQGGKKVREGKFVSYTLNANLPVTVKIKRGLLLRVDIKQLKKIGDINIV